MTLWEHGVPLIQWGVVIGASLVGAVTDLTDRRIPNRLTGPLLVGGLIWAGYVGGVSGLCDSALACVMLGTPYVLLFLLAGGGAGDAKLMGAIGAWVGIVGGILVLAAVSVAAIVLGVGNALARKRLRLVLGNIVAVLTGLVLMVLMRGKLENRRDVVPRIVNMQIMPYGVAIFVGVCIGAMGTLLWHI